MSQVIEGQKSYPPAGTPRRGWVWGSALAVVVVGVVIAAFAVVNTDTPTRFSSHMGNGGVSMDPSQPWVNMHGDMGRWMHSHPGWVSQRWDEMGQWMSQHPGWMRRHWGEMGTWMADHRAWTMSHWDSVGRWMQAHPNWMRDHFGEMGPWMGADN